MASFHRKLQRLFGIKKSANSAEKHELNIPVPCPSEQSIKNECLRKLLCIWADPVRNRGKMSSIALAIEGSHILLPYLKFKYPIIDNVDWSQYFEDCMDLRLYLLSELIKLGHGKYINNTNQNGNTPLLISCALKEPRLVKFLLHHGSSITQPFRCGQCSTLAHDETFSIYCRHHVMDKMERFDCNELQEEYARVANMTVNRVPDSFFASKNDAIQEILLMMQKAYGERQVQLIKVINCCKSVPPDLVPIIVEYVPL